MGLFNTFSEALRESTSLKVAVLLFILLAYPVSNLFYNLYFHPLAKFPGPKLWAVSRLPFVFNLLRGNLIKRQRQLHEKYGPILRMAPDEISFANEEAWNDIYAWRKGHKRALRDPAFAIAPESKVDNIITTSNAKFHARVRGLVSTSFSEDSLSSQASLVESHADMFVDQFHRAAIALENSDKGALFDLTDWLNFFTMDVIGDLTFGESFGCLANGQYHDWVRTLANYLKAMTLNAVPSYYPAIKFLFEKMIPKSIIEGQRLHYKYASDRINRRLDSKSERPDFMTPFMKKNPNFEIMSREEIISTFNFIIVGGSETSATTMTGIFNHLLKPKNKAILDRLTREIREMYASEHEITISAVNKPDHLYLEAVLNEGLRICHPVPSGLPRMVPEGGDEYAGVFLPGGTRLGVRTFTVNRSEKYFHKPDTFAPERWLPQGERPSEFDGDRLSASKPFSIGFHSCVGKPLAWLEMRLIITRLLWAFDFAEEDGMHVDFDNFPILMMVQKESMMIRVRAREGVKYKGLPSDSH